jgi:UDP-N-acetylglucosamine 4,6-dehydratase/UDP-glucose 4-epimerase
LCKWRDLILEGKEVIVTEPNATRFFWTSEQAVDLIFEAIKKGTAKPYRPKVMKSMQVGQLLLAMIQRYSWMTPREYPVKNIGLQPGENMHETLGEGLDSDTSKQYTTEEIKELI